MGVDSGLPDFRGPEGFWAAYPPYEALGLDFYAIANPRWFTRDLALAWGFYGHRRNLYRSTTPHPGFGILRRWAEAKPGGYFVVTSNVDGQFQRAGFDPDRVCEIHGSIDREQCVDACYPAWEAAPGLLDIDETSMRARGPVPRCPSCGGPARPNLVMFMDFGWQRGPVALQESRRDRWLWTRRARKVVAIEIGAGSMIPSVRLACENHQTAGLIRINPREPEGARLGLPLGGLEALQRIDALLG